jgi:hypothetical protein
MSEEKLAQFKRIAERVFPDYKWDLGDTQAIFDRCQQGVIRQREKLVQILCEELL